MVVAAPDGMLLAPADTDLPAPADGDTGAKEARLLRLLEQMKRRLEGARVENAQLEEMLRTADARLKGFTFAYNIFTGFHSQGLFDALCV